MAAASPPQWRNGERTLTAAVRSIAGRLGAILTNHGRAVAWRNDYGGFLRRRRIAAADTGGQQRYHTQRDPENFHFPYPTVISTGHSLSNATRSDCRPGSRRGVSRVLQTGQALFGKDLRQCGGTSIRNDSINAVRLVRVIQRVRTAPRSLYMENKPCCRGRQTHQLVDQSDGFPPQPP